MPDINIVPFNEQVIYKTGYTAPATLPTDFFQIDAILSGTATVSATLTVQVTDNPNDEESWTDSGVEFSLTGQKLVRVSDFGFSTKKYFRIQTKTLTGFSLIVVAKESNSSRFPSRVALLSDVASVSKSKVYTLASRDPMTIDVHISGTATVRLYASNIETSATGSKWGTHLREFTASEKIIIENEPWVYWMAEYVSGTGTVNISLGM